MLDIHKMFAEDPSQMPLGDEEQVVIPADQQEKDEAQEAEKPKKNHQDRRWDKLFSKLEETQEKLSEYERFKQDVENGRYAPTEAVPDHFKKMYEDGLTMEERWKAQQDYESSQKERIKQEAKQEILNEIKKEKQEQDRWEDFIDSNLESLEEQYGIDFTSGSAKSERLKKDFLQVVAKLSPKDENGNITAYASFEDSFDLWNQTKQVKDTTVVQKKDIASLSANRGQAPQIPDTDSAEGGMWGWKKYLKE